MSEESVSAQIEAKLDGLLKLTAMILVQGKPQRVQVWLLHRAGFQPKGIADLLGTTANTVNVALSGLRKLGVGGIRKVVWAAKGE